MLCERLVRGYNELEYDEHAVRTSLGGHGLPYPWTWSDEHPCVDGIPGRLPGCHEQCRATIERLLRVRQALWRTGSVPAADREFWDEMSVLIPLWPGFRRLDTPPVETFDKFVQWDSFKGVFRIYREDLEEKLHEVLASRGILVPDAIVEDLAELDWEPFRTRERDPGLEQALLKVRLWSRRQAWAESWIDPRRPSEMTFEDLRRFESLGMALLARARRIGELLESLKEREFGPEGYEVP
jgi:hypothetical protein